MRVSKVKTPILILSGLAGIEDKVKGLGFGADDYMTKPFHKDELIARIHAIVRRSKGHAQSVINTGDLVVNLDTKTVEVGGQRVHLTGKEYQMLELLSLRKGTTLTKEMFLNHLYGGMDEPELKIIDVFICKLRKKLANASSGKNYIETVWGRGYVLREPTEMRRAHSGVSFNVAFNRAFGAISNKPRRHRRGSYLRARGCCRVTIATPSARELEHVARRRAAVAAGRIRHIEPALVGHRLERVGQADHGLGGAQHQEAVGRHLARDAG